MTKFISSTSCLTLLRTPSRLYDMFQLVNITCRVTCCIAIVCTGLSALTCNGSDSSPFFPIGIYGVQNAQDLEIIHEAGFNCAIGSVNPTLLDKAQSLGIRIIASPGRTSDNDQNRKRLQDIDTHPAFFSWYLVDEPDMHRIPPWKVAMDHRRLKAVPTKSPISVVLYNGANAAEYGAIPDILMVDHYPVPWMPLAHFAQHMSWARNSISHGKPAYAVLQAFDWYYFRNLLPGENNFRVPTFEELQCMTFMSLAQGMDGIIYYTLRAGDWDILKHPDMWNGLQKVIRSIKENDYLLTAKRQWWLPNTETSPYAMRKNAALESSISMTLFEDVDGMKHVMLINTTPHSLALKIQLPNTKHRWASVFQKDTPFGGFKSDTIYNIPFSGYQVRLLKGFRSKPFAFQ